MGQCHLKELTCVSSVLGLDCEYREADDEEIDYVWPDEVTPNLEATLTKLTIDRCTFLDIISEDETNLLDKLEWFEYKKRVAVSPIFVWDTPFTTIAKLPRLQHFTYGLVMGRNCPPEEVKLDWCFKLANRELTLINCTDEDHQFLLQRATIDAPTGIVSETLSPTHTVFSNGNGLKVNCVVDPTIEIFKNKIRIVRSPRPVGQRRGFGSRGLDSDEEEASEEEEESDEEMYEEINEEAEEEANEEINEEAEEEANEEMNEEAEEEANEEMNGRQKRMRTMK